MKVELHFEDQLQVDECITALSRVMYWKDEQQLLFGENETCAFIEILLNKLKKEEGT